MGWSWKVRPRGGGVDTSARRSMSRIRLLHNSLTCGAWRDSILSAQQLDTVRMGEGLGSAAND